MSLRDMQNQLRAEVKQLLEKGKIRKFIGFEQGWDAAKAVPVLIGEASAADRLVLNAFCGTTIAKYVLDEAIAAEMESDQPPLGLLAKGCDGLALARLIRDHRVPGEDVYVVGVNCQGMVDGDKARSLIGLAVTAAEIRGDEVILTTADGEVTLAKADCLMNKCLSCENPMPENYDILLGDEATGGPVGQRDFAGVDALEALTPDERYQFWSRQFERCLRCFACRNACAACNCVTCSLDDRDVEWLGRSTELSEQFMFHFTRAYHVAGRCVACGECERVCPVGIPLMLLNEKLMRDIRDLFEVDDPHVPSEIEPLGKFSPEDPEGWREEAEKA